jgi:hypothetical protein
VTPIFVLPTATGEPPTIQPTKMTVTMTVAYPPSANRTFDADYYIKSHVPMVAAVWKPLGLKSWRMLTPLDSKSAPYVMVFEADWPNMATLGNMQKSIDPVLGKKIQDDLVNYYDQPPVIWLSEKKEEDAPSKL